MEDYPMTNYVDPGAGRVAPLLVDHESVEPLNDLIETLISGREGFHQAAEHVSDPELRNLFSEYSQQRDSFATELSNRVVNLGGQPSTTGGTSIGGAVHRAWIAIKDAFTGSEHDRLAILEEVERGEDVAVKAYKQALESQYFPESARELAAKQFAAVQAAHDRVRDLRNRYRNS
jgi:uncharacterized protein (TIGR02284 family)